MTGGVRSAAQLAVEGSRCVVEQLNAPAAIPVAPNHAGTRQEMAYQAPKMEKVWGVSGSLPARAGLLTRGNLDEFGGDFSMWRES